MKRNFQYENTVSHISQLHKAKMLMTREWEREAYLGAIIR